MDEFKKGISVSCKGKTYKDFPEAFKFFIDSSFRTIDIDGTEFGGEILSNKIWALEVETLVV